MHALLTNDLSCLNEKIWLFDKWSNIASFSSSSFYSFASLLFSFIKQLCQQVHLILILSSRHFTSPSMHFISKIFLSPSVFYFVSLLLIIQIFDGNNSQQPSLEEMEKVNLMSLKGSMLIITLKRSILLIFIIIVLLNRDWIQITVE